jgi:hypothetical protein
MKLAGSPLSLFLDTLECCFAAAADVVLTAFSIAIVDRSEA